MLKTETAEQRDKTLRLISLTMGFFALAYTGTIIVFTFVNEPFFALLHQVWGILGVSSEPFPDHTFYRSLAMGNMYMLVAMSYWTWKDPVGYRKLFPVVFVSKLSSSLMGIAFFLFSNGYWSNLVIPFTDLSQVFMAAAFFKATNAIAAIDGTE